MSVPEGQPERLEDQLRRMMLNNAPPPPNPNVPFPPPSFSQYPHGPPGVPGPSSDPMQGPMHQHAPHPPQVQLPFGSQPGNQSYGQTQSVNRSGNGFNAPFAARGRGGNDYVPPHFRQQPTQHAPAPHGARGRGGNDHVPPQFRQHRGQQVPLPLDANAFSRPSVPRGGYMQHQQHQQRHLFDPNAYGQPRAPPAPMVNAVKYLEDAAARVVPQAGMSREELAEKDVFRATLESICHQVCAADPVRLPKVSLHCFGSLMSGFASNGSDMDLVIVVDSADATSAQFSLLEHDLPRALEEKLLRLGYGARLLTRTRVPIIKICEKPGPSFLDKLRAERERWDILPNEKKYPHLHQDDGEHADDDEEALTTQTNGDGQDAPDAPEQAGAPEISAQIDQPDPTIKDTEALPPTSPNQPKHRAPKPFTRERKAGPLDFPKHDVGILCDINFFNPLGIHNSHLLRCYSLCDPRVRYIVLFIKTWSKNRKINSSYSGTLPSYGYVLMVLHYLMNVAKPAVIPNLQGPWRPSSHCTLPGASATKVEDWEVDFWRNEIEITHAADHGLITQNQESVGSLLAGFFRYFASQGGYPTFNWMRDVIALKKPGGLHSKQEKGWTGARTEQTGGKEVRHRYLFCIEDPFELSHNVARTVTHYGIVAIRDEFRRANRILMDVGFGRMPKDGELLEVLVEPTEEELQPDFVNMPEMWSKKPQQDAAPTPSASQQLQPQPQTPSQGFAQASAQSGVPANAPLNGPGVFQGGPSRGQRGGRFPTSGRGQQTSFRGQRGGAMQQHQQSRPSPQRFDSNDQDAFPALGGLKLGKRGN